MLFSRNLIVQGQNVKEYNNFIRQINTMQSGEKKKLKQYDEFLNNREENIQEALDNTFDYKEKVELYITLLDRLIQYS